VTALQQSVANIKALAEQLYAIILLEYHNRDLLVHGVNPKKLSEDQQRLIKSILREVDDE